MTTSLGLLEIALLVLAAALLGATAVAGARLLLTRTHVLVTRAEWHRLLASRDAALREAFDHRRQVHQLESALMALSSELTRTEEAIAATAAARRAGEGQQGSRLKVV